MVALLLTLLLLELSTISSWPLPSFCPTIVPLAQVIDVDTVLLTALLFIAPPAKDFSAGVTILSNFSRCETFVASSSSSTRRRFRDYHITYIHTNIHTYSKYIKYFKQSKVSNTIRKYIYVHTCIHTNTTV